MPVKAQKTLKTYTEGKERESGIYLPGAQT